MESRSTRDHGCHHLNQQLRPPWSYGFSLASGISWPPQMRSSSSSYTCGYCKREFRSAQALGGHMNVHRRERAWLRHYCNPSFPTHRPAPPLPNLNFSPPHFPGDGASTTAAAPAVYSFFSTASAATGATAKAALEVSLELGVGGFSDGGLDLELRLGCS